MFRITVLEGAEKGRIQEFEHRQVTLGRDEAADFPLEDPMVSRFHGLLELRPQGRFAYQDLDSANGSFLRLGEGNPKFLESESQFKLHVLLETRAQLLIGHTLLQIEGLHEAGQANPDVSLSTGIGALETLSFDSTAPETMNFDPTQLPDPTEVVSVAWEEPEESVQA